MDRGFANIMSYPEHDEFQVPRDEREYVNHALGVCDFFETARGEKIVPSTAPPLFLGQGALHLNTDENSFDLRD